ncbi:hypothetical protein BHM03_00008490 [Ensete ventricosum]|nr:hypothetical protein BHM03_00008490 [Ensete ventricosum]
MATGGVGCSKAVATIGGRWGSDLRNCCGGGNGIVGGTYEERDSEQDKREVGYSPRAKDTQYGAPTGKRSHKESLQWRKPASMFLKRAWRNSTKANEGSFGIESSQEEAESRIDKVES